MCGSNSGSGYYNDYHSNHCGGHFDDSDFDNDVDYKVVDGSDDDNVNNADNTDNHIAYFFAYGSLMNMAELAKCLQTTKANIVERVLLVTVAGAARGWLNQCKRQPCNGLQLSPTYLCCYFDAGDAEDDNVNSSKSSNSNITTINGILLPVTIREQQLIDQRESGACYHVRRIAADKVSCYSCADRHHDNKLPIYCYCCCQRSASQASQHHPIVQSYLDVCLTGTLEIDELLASTDYQFSRDFIASINFWSGQHWLNDRLYKYRPTIFVAQAHLINRLLVEMLPASVIADIKF